VLYFLSAKEKELSTQNPAQISFRNEGIIKTFSGGGTKENLLPVN
jgi:hypothetical protein